jgi:hypothetical protein
MVLNELNGEQEFVTYINQTKVTYVMFTYNNCLACDVMKDIIVKKYPKIEVATINFRYFHNDKSHLNGIQLYPTFCKYSKGKRLGIFSNANENKFDLMIRSNLNENGPNWNEASK